VGPIPIPVTDAVGARQLRPEIVTMRPGLTGLWRFHEDNLVFRERVKMDLAYVRNYSVFLDIKIMIQTVFLVWRRWATADESLSRWMSSEED
jgi:lipopolysaccharide/colanic/teichoic acid biosynthesis glycosyltransferase